MLVAARSVTPWLLPAVILGGLVFVGLVGALQLRHDDRLSEKSFLALVGLTFRQLPLLGRLSKKSE
jgi:internalin A